MVGVPQLSGKQKVYAALVILAAEPGEIEERLEAAYRLALAPVDAQLDIPPQLVAEFQEIRAALQNEYFGKTPKRVAASREARRWARDMAARVVAFYDKLARIK